MPVMSLSSCWEHKTLKVLYAVEKKLLREFLVENWNLLSPRGKYLLSIMASLHNDKKWMKGNYTA